MVIKTHEDAIRVLSSIDGALDRLSIKGVENAFIVAGSHNDLLAVVDYLNADIKRVKSTPVSKPEPEIEKE